MKKPKLTVYTLEHRDDLKDPWSRTPCDGWVLVTSGALVDVSVRTSKMGATHLAAVKLDRAFTIAGQHSELRIRNKNGTFAPARTYPRSADPRRSKG